MCTRFYIEAETEEVKEILDAVRSSRLADRFIKAGHAVRVSGEIRPTDVIPVLAPAKDGRRAAFPMQWGFLFPGKPPLVNARSETAALKSAFQEAWYRHRCVIPASWYYEWEHFTDSSGKIKTGDKYMIQPRGYTMTYLAGLYCMEDGLAYFTVLTKEPPEDLKAIHDRMPLIFPPERIDEWLRPDSRPEELLRYALTDMTAEKTAARM